MAEHEIWVKEGPPVRQKMRCVPVHMRDEFKRFLYEMRITGMIRDSFSDWSSAINLVRKKDGKIRITNDYRKLNDVTIKDCYPIPKIDEL